MINCADKTGMHSFRRFISFKLLFNTEMPKYNNKLSSSFIPRSSDFSRFNDVKHRPVWMQVRQLKLGKAIREDNSIN